ncbi:polyprenol phosphomannose-dependent alpha 1,6 mannosyltransferase MptB [Corynebacterium sp. TAE3-ERU2]|uniref:polyprenol phosphomannose-dependent alpha 1,6 mannosyltransferase MptB n=1 Tax=Corynebacterium sp. TAE3-ERU2 TaxID=2849497 RepID=UPI001C4630CF|nr:polyprenol phosphomannose-dependent alpha 1,6 mannosyltransferase MptB [Corynebacterium sp. TAE3-ERU2]
MSDPQQPRRRRAAAAADDFKATLPRLGHAGSRSASLHIGAESEAGGSTIVRAATGHDLLPVSSSRAPRRLDPLQLARFATLRWLGTLGALMLALGGLGAGAKPVLGDPYTSFPGGSIMGRMIQTSSILVITGAGLMVIAWLLIAPFVGADIARPRHSRVLVSTSMLARTFVAWVAPIFFTAPLFTQDIYSYLAQGAIVDRGFDPYSAGPVDILGTDDVLARSVPLIWSHSPSPYGPVALGIASVIAKITGDSIAAGVFAHRIVSLVGMLLAAWALSQLATRCGVSVQAALWLGILNPLAILHLVGGIHNESIQLGLVLLGMELGLRGIDRLSALQGPAWQAWGLVVASGVLISGAGMVKVTGFIGLGFIGMALARHFHLRGRHTSMAVLSAGAVQLAVLIGSVAAVTALTGIPTGWISGQGGAATIRSWLSLTTDIGVIGGWIGMLLELGDHTEALLTITRGVGLLLAAAFMVRMLFATYRGTIHPIGGLGVATFMLVILFPVVHPWYMLWAILPLAAWANRRLFRAGAAGYCALLSLFIMPRGLSLPPTTVIAIYVGSALLGVVFLTLVYVFLRRRGIVGWN